MALIKCNKCSQEVSGKSVVCAKCSAPVVGAIKSQAAGVPFTKTQDTSKKFKLQLLISGLIFWIGMVWYAVEIVLPAPDDDQSNIGPMVVLAGIAWNITTRIRQWWHYK